MTPPVHFLAIDPGLAARGGSGWAFFSLGVLVDCGLLRNKLAWRRLSRRVAGQAELLRGVRANLFVGSGAGFTIPAVSEWMTKRYGPEARKMDVQDIIDLNALSGHLGTHWVTPTEWKGGIPRPTEIDRSMKTLSAEEKEVVAAVARTVPKLLMKEVTSAIGIGLSVARRAHRKVGWPE